MTNYKYPAGLGFNLNVSKHFSEADKAHVARAMDNIITEFAEIAVNAEALLLDDVPISPQEINEIEQRALEVNAPELEKLVDWLAMYDPEITHNTLVAAL